MRNRNHAYKLRRAISNLKRSVRIYDKLSFKVHYHKITDFNIDRDIKKMDERKGFLVDYLKQNGVETKIIANALKGN